MEGHMQHMWNVNKKGMVLVSIVVNIKLWIYKTPTRKKLCHSNDVKLVWFMQKVYSLVLTNEIDSLWEYFRVLYLQIGYIQVTY